MVTPRGEAAQTPASATSKRGLSREARTALRRVRTRPECPEGNLRELTWAGKPDCGIATTQKALTWDTARPAHRTKDWLELASCRLALPRWRQAGKGSQSWKGAITAPERHHLPNCKQTSLLTKASWDSGWSTSSWEGALVVHPENRVAGTREEISRSDRTHQTPGYLSCLFLGRAQKAGPTESAPLWSTREPEPEWLRPGKCIQPRAHLRQFPAEQARAWAV